MGRTSAPAILADSLQAASSPKVLGTVRPAGKQLFTLQDFILANLPSISTADQKHTNRDPETYRSRRSSLDEEGEGFPFVCKTLPIFFPRAR